MIEKKFRHYYKEKEYIDNINRYQKDIISKSIKVRKNTIEILTCYLFSAILLLPLIISILGFGDFIMTVIGIMLSIGVFIFYVDVISKKTINIPEKEYFYANGFATNIWQILNFKKYFSKREKKFMKLEELVLSRKFITEIKEYSDLLNFKEIEILRDIIEKDNQARRRYIKSLEENEEFEEILNI